MQKYETALFDLDGTITDSGPGIMESVQYALTKFGYAEQSEETLRQFVGPSLVDSFTRLYHMTYKEAEQATAAYREVYNTGNLYHAKLYDGIEMVFQRLLDAGIRIVLLTSKPQGTAERVLDHFGITKYFFHVTGPDEHDPSSDKSRLIRRTVEETGIDLSRSIMIGDTHFDIEGANAVSMDSIAVTYGYGPRESLLSCHPTYMVDAPEGIADILLAPELVIRLASPEDAEELLRIYEPYVRNTAISFEIEVPSVEEFQNRIRDTLKKYPYYVAELGGRIVGYAYLSAFKERAAYDYSAETSIYVDPSVRHRSIGKKLYHELEDIAKAMGLRNLNACIGYTQVPDEHLDNNSVAFHEHLGYHMVGTFHKCGYKFQHWYDMVWMEKLISEHDVPVRPVRWFPVLAAGD